MIFRLLPPIKWIKYHSKFRLEIYIFNWNNIIVNDKYNNAPTGCTAPVCNSLYNIAVYQTFLPVKIQILLSSMVSNIIL